MKKNLKVLFALLGALTLISCTVNEDKDTKSSNSSSNIENSNVSSLIEESSLDTSSSIEQVSSIEQNSSKDESSSSLLEDTYYHVTFLNDDEETVLYEIDVKEGEEAVYNGETPTKEEDDEFTYTFQGWDKEEELKSVNSDITTKAVYEAVGKEGWGSIIWF